jgi:hypothetical protein
MGVCQRVSQHVGVRIAKKSDNLCYVVKQHNHVFSKLQVVRASTYKSYALQATSGARQHVQIISSSLFVYHVNAGDIAIQFVSIYVIFFWFPESVSYPFSAPARKNM